MGDFPFKGNADLPAEKQMVSPEPDILVIDRNEKDNYLIFACDGIWDAITEPQECVNIVSDLLVGGEGREIGSRNRLCLWKWHLRIFLNFASSGIRRII